MATYGISTPNGMENLLDSNRPAEVVLAKGFVDYDANPIWANTDWGCGYPIQYNGQYHTPVVVTLTKFFRGQTYLGSFPSRPYFYLFENCTLVAGDSLGRSVGFYGGANHSSVPTPCGYPRAVWSEDDNEIVVRYFGVYSGTETEWRSSARMTGRLYVMLVGELPPDAQQELPDFGLTMHDSAGTRTTFNSNYEPSNPRHFIERPNSNLNNYRTNTPFIGDMDGGVKMTTICPIANCHAGGSQNHYSKVWPCFSADGRRIGTRMQGWGSADQSAPPSQNARTQMMEADQLLRVWNASDYFDIP